MADREHHPGVHRVEPVRVHVGGQHRRTETAQGVEGQKQGLLFYGLQGGQAQPWGSGTSFLCVKSPTQRSTGQDMLSPQRSS